MQSSKIFILLAAAALIGFAGNTQETIQNPTSSTQQKAGVVITGIVKDAATSTPLRGIRVSYKDLSAAITDSVGAFSLKVASTRVSINIEGEGYQSKEIALRGRTNVTASLYEESYASFYDVATLPNGQVKLSQTPYAVTSIQTNGAWSEVNETPTTYLQGKVAGLNVIRRSGTPNAGATLSLRGITSLYATNQPLIVVDGVIFDNNDYGGSILSNHYTEPLSTIDVKDIDNITVVKDGSTLYGTKGANGVILITTARAKQLGTKIDFAVYGGAGLTPSNIPVLDASDYRMYLSDLLKTKGLSDAQIAALPYMNDNTSNPEYYKYHNNTDWQKEVLHKSYTKNVYLKVTGGDNIAKYGLSMGFMNSDGVTGNTDLTRYNMRFNGDLNLSKRMTATTNLSFAFNEQNLRDQGTALKTNPLYLALVKSPLLRPYEVSDQGAQSPQLDDRDTFNIGNPLALTNVAQGSNKNYRFFGNIGFNYQLSSKFSLASTIAITNEKVRENFFVPRKGVTPDTLSTDIAFSRMGSNVKTLFALYNDTRLAYSQHFNNVHEVSARLGFRYQYTKTERDFGLGYNSAIDELVSVGNGVNALRRVGGDNGQTKWLNTYFSTDYSYADKYIVSVNVSVDGSSRYGNNIPDALKVNGNSYAVLPSLAGAWLISSENFMQNSGISLLKLRASYGLSGNDDIGNYTGRQTYVSQNLLGIQGLARGGFGNDQIQWETVKKMNLGLDVSLFNERLNASVDVYQNRISDMIAYEAAPVASGFSYTATNSAKMRTTGAELSVNGRAINKAALKWDLGFTIAKNKTTINGLPGSEIISSFNQANYITQKGSTPNLFYGYKTAGVYVSDAVAAQEGLSIRNANGTLTAFTGGDVRFTDVNGDKIIDQADQVVIGDPNPDYFGSFSNRFVYKNFSLDALFTFVGGNDIYNYTRNQLEAMKGYENQTQSIRNRWRTNGHVTDVPKAVWGDPMGNSRFSDRWIEDGSYIRLRDVTLSYSIPFKPGFFQYAVVYATGNNLVTWTKYKGYDPEFNATESIYGRGVENILEPQFRSVILGLRVGL